MRIADLFCGAGGFSYGFHQEGFEIVFGLDHWRRCQNTYEHNHYPTSFIKMDIQDARFDAFDRAFAPIDVIIGSPPCVEFSTCNSTEKEIDKGLELVKKFLDFVDFFEPKYWIMENVPAAEKYIRSLLTERVRVEVLNAADFGVPQKRERLFIGEYPMPKQTHSEELGQLTLQGNKLQPWRNMEEIIEETVNHGYVTANQEHTLRRMKSLRVTSGGHRTFCKMPYPDPLDEPSRTLLANISRSNRSTIVVNPDGIPRTLTLLERARLMGFPDDFLFFSTPSDTVKMIGNAVCPPVSRALAKAIKEAEA